MRSPPNPSLRAPRSEGKLNAARAIERAKTGDLVDGSSATCAELDKLLETDREAIEFEKEKVDARFGGDKATVQATTNAAPQRWK